MKKLLARFDERLELLTVLFYMTKYKDVLPFIINLQEEEEFSLYKKIVATFEHIDISAMTKPFEELLETENFGFDAPIEMFLCIQPDFSSYYLKEKLYEERLRKNPLVIELLEAVLVFGKSDEWRQFYQSNKNFYAKVINGLESLDLSNIFELMEQLYGKQMLQGVEYEVLLMSGTFAGNYGPHVNNTFYCVSGLENGTWYLNQEPTIIIHEFSHSVINPLTDQYLEKEYAEDEELFTDVEEKMKKHGYSKEPVTVINEYMVRTVECCYLKRCLPEKYEEHVQYQKGRGFVHIEFLIERYSKFLEEKGSDFISFYKSLLPQFVVYLKFESLIEETRRCVEENSTAQEVILVKTAKGNIYTCVNNNYVIENDMIMSVGDFKDETDFIQMLVDADDVEIKYIVCMWKNGGIEAPSMHFRKALLDICPKNEDAICVGQGADKLVFKTIKERMP